MNFYKHKIGDQVQVEGINGQAKIVDRNFGSHTHYDLPGKNYEVIFQSKVEGVIVDLPEITGVYREGDLM